MATVLAVGTFCTFLLNMACGFWPRLNGLMILANLVAISSTHLLMHIMVLTAGYRVCADFGPRLALWLGLAAITTYYLLFVRLVQLFSGVEQVYIA